MVTQKRLIGILMAIVMMFSMLVVPTVKAEGNITYSNNYKIAHTNIASDSEDYDNDELFAAYVEQLFYKNSFSVFGTAAGNRLSGDEKLLYDALVPIIKQIANGSRATTTVVIGQPVVISGNIYDVDAVAEFSSTIPEEIDIAMVVDALLADLPFEMYWYDKVTGAEVSVYCDSKVVQYVVQFTVAENYRGDGIYVSNLSKTGAAAVSVANAITIIDDYYDASDYEKLKGYKDAICELVEYNFEAAEEMYFSENNDPWQLLYVFDKDDTTSVTCEGYAKAFMYLCDMTEFSGDVSCYTVMGTMDGGDHMWNIVTKAGNNYLVDVTNSDTGSSGEDGSLFMTGAIGDAVSGYIVNGNTYIYDNDTLSLWGTETNSILNLSDSDYDPSTESEEDAIFGTCDENLTWKFDEGILTISGEGKICLPGGSGYAPWDYLRTEIKTVIISEGITSLSGCVFYDCDKLTEINFPESLLSIGSSAVVECDSLTEINIPKNVSEINPEPFSSCDSLTEIIVDEYNLNFVSEEGVLFSKDKTELISYLCTKTDTTYVIPSTVTTIHRGAFSGCENLTEVYIPDGVTEILTDTFMFCSNLKKISIGKEVSSISTGAFMVCDALTEILVSEENKAYDSVDGVLFTEDLKTLVKYPPCMISDGYYAIPNGTTKIAYDAFEGSSLSNIEIPKTVTYISGGAFSECDSLTRIIVPSSVTYVGSVAFGYSKNLTQVIFTGEAPNIDSTAFIGSPITCYYPVATDSWNETVSGDHFIDSVTWISYEGDPNDIPVIGAPGDDGDSGEGTGGSGSGSGEGEGSGGSGSGSGEGEGSGGSGSGSGEGSGGSGSGSGEGEGSVDVGVAEDFAWSLENGVLTISGTGKMPDYDYEYPPWFDMNESIVSVVIEPGITNIGSHAFSWHSNLKNVTIPEGVTEIKSGAFYDSCLEEIDLPNSIVNIAPGAFSNCKNLLNINIGVENEYYTVVDGVLFNKEMTQLVKYLPASNRTVYEIPDTVKSLAGYSFSSAQYLEYVIIPNTVKDLGYDTFNSCTALKEVTVPEGVTSINRAVFYGCTNLRKVDLPDTVTVIGLCAFTGCSNLSEIEIPSNLTYFGNQAFSECRSLKTVTIPKNIISTGHSTFSSCESLEIVNILGSKTVLESDVFGYCYNLKRINIVSTNTNYTSIDGVLFNKDITTLVKYANGEGRESYTIPETVTEIGDSAFSSKVLKNVEFPSGLIKIGSSAFYSCDGLLSVNLPEGLQELGGGAFMVCERLEKVYIPGSVKIIESSAFYSCSGLAEVEISEGVEKINDHVFNYCRSLEEITIPESVTFIGPGIFDECISLKKIMFKGDAPEIGNHAFRLITATVYYPKDNPTWIGDVRQDYMGNITWEAYAVETDNTQSGSTSSVASVPMYRMYNPNSGEHFYTGSTEERNILVNAGWKYEGVAFNFPVVGKPVYRLYEPKTGEHLYTMDENEKAKLLSEGWNYEGVAFNSAGEDEVAQYRLHNPNATCGAYHFTGSKEERDILIAAGWEYQGIGWYSCLR